jgi:nucleoid-associated protein YgaU
MEDKLKQLLKTIKLNENVLSMLFGIVTVLLIGVLVFRMYRANKPSITPDAEKIEITDQKLGEVKVEIKEDGKKYPATLPEKVTVEPGQHLWAIAEKYYGSGYNWVDIAKANNLKNAGYLAVGQELKLPPVAIKEVATAKKIEVEGTAKIEGSSYTVAKGDHLWGIAVRAYGDGFKWTEIANFNAIKNPNYIEVGQVIKLQR